MSEVFDEDTGEFRKRTLSNWQVLLFISQYWLRRKWAFFGTIAAILVAIGFESMMPRATKALTDATLHQPPSATVAWEAWAFFVGVYLAFQVIRNLAFLVLESARRRQHGRDDQRGVRSGCSRSRPTGMRDTFAGATVRRISRAMWGYDVVSDCVHRLDRARR